MYTPFLAINLSGTAVRGETSSLGGNRPPRDRKGERAARIIRQGYLLNQYLMNILAVSLEIIDVSRGLICLRLAPGPSRHLSLSRWALAASFAGRASQRFVVPFA